MVLQSAGSAIKFSEIQDEFGGTNPISLSEYYIGGGLVPATVIGGGSPGTFTAFFGRQSVILPFLAVTGTPSQQFYFHREIDGTSGSLAGMLNSSGNEHIYKLVWENVTILTSTSTDGTATFPGTVNAGSANSVTFASAYNSALNSSNDVIISTGGFDYQIGSQTFSEVTIFDDPGTVDAIEHNSFQTVRRRTSSTQTTSSVNPNVPASGEVSMSDYYGGRDD
tara:strand:+ start:161 stop:829 length:669 start_codon:yes stop_codon:yes gene_type:complete